MLPIIAVSSHLGITVASLLPSSSLDHRSAIQSEIKISLVATPGTRHTDKSEKCHIHVCDRTRLGEMTISSSFVISRENSGIERRGFSEASGLEGG
jgi:hypothetical protein